MSAESERIFSGARRTITWTRCRLGAKMVEQTECLKHWVRSGLSNYTEWTEDDIEEAVMLAEDEFEATN